MRRYISIFVLLGATMALSAACGPDPQNSGASLGQVQRMTNSTWSIRALLDGSKRVDASQSKAMLTFLPARLEISDGANTYGFAISERENLDEITITEILPVADVGSNDSTSIAISEFVATLKVGSRVSVFRGEAGKLTLGFLQRKIEAVPA